MMPGRGHRRGLTLLEVIIAIGLIAMIMTAMFLFYWQMLETRKAAAEQSNRTQLARQVLAGLEAELRGTIGTEQIGFPTTQGEQRLVGDRRTLTFLSTGLPAENQYEIRREVDKPPPAQHDLRLISYSLWVDPTNKTDAGDPIVGGIIRSEKKTLNQFVVEEDDPLDIRKDVWAPELGYLEFRYFDGVEWDTTWDITEGNALPQLIQITVGYKNITQDEYDDKDLDAYPILEYPFGDGEVRSDRYSVIVKLPAADKFFGSRAQRMGKKYSSQLGVEGTGLK